MAELGAERNKRFNAFPKARWGLLLLPSRHCDGRERLLLSESRADARSRFNQSARRAVHHESCRCRGVGVHAPEVRRAGRPRPPMFLAESLTQRAETDALP